MKTKRTKKRTRKAAVKAVPVDLSPNEPFRTRLSSDGGPRIDLHLRDCISGCRELAAESIDLIVTSIPEG